MNIKNNKGITLITLTITIIVLAIIAGITVYSGIDTVKRTNLESMRTNMLLIQAKAKEYVEEANFKIGQNSDVTEKSKIVTDIFSSIGCKSPYPDIPTINGNDTRGYWLVTETTFEKMGLTKIYDDLQDGENYLLKVDVDKITVEVYNTLGYQGNYSLTELEELQ